MPGIVDIVKLTETVDFNGTQITVKGVGINKIGQALSQSKEIQRFMSGVSFDAMSLIEAVPETIAILIAGAIVEDYPAVADLVTTEAGGLEPGVDAPLISFQGSAKLRLQANVDAFKELSADDQLKLLEAVIRVTFPGGVSPFIDRLGKIVGQDGLAEKIAQYGREQGTISPPPLMN